MHLLALLALACLASLATCTDYSTNFLCRPGLGRTTSVQFNNCPDGVDPCKLHYGDTANITINFDYLAKYTVNSTEAQVFLYYSKYDDDFDEPVGIYNSEACEDLGCPLQPGNSYSYQATIKFEDEYPQAAYRMRWRLLSFYKKNPYSILACPEINIRFYTTDYPF